MKERLERNQMILKKVMDVLEEEEIINGIMKDIKDRISRISGAGDDI